MQNTIDKSLQRQVMALLGWDEQKYAEFIEQCGITYLEKYIPDYPQVRNQIIKDKIFWNWWKAHWQTRDKEFVEQCYNWDEGVDTRVELYKENNDPRTLALAIYLNGQVLEESYAVMIGQITKAQREEVLV